MGSRVSRRKVIDPFTTLSTDENIIPVAAFRRLLASF